MMKLLIPAAVAWATLSSASAQTLLIDFNSTTQDNGVHNETGWQPYDAAHEVPSDFVPISYPALGGTVTVTPTWPDTTDNRVQQAIDRSATFDGNYTGILPDLMTDFIGADSRTGNGGNGDGNKTTFNLEFLGIPSGQYHWLSYHHDTEFMHGTFDILMNGTNLGNVTVSHSSVREDTGAVNPTSDPATFEFDFASDGSPINMTFEITPPTTGANVHTQFVVLNGLAISVIPEPSSALLVLASVAGFAFTRWRQRSL